MKKSSPPWGAYVGPGGLEGGITPADGRESFEPLDSGIDGEATDVPGTLPVLCKGEWVGHGSGCGPHLVDAAGTAPHLIAGDERAVGHGVRRGEPRYAEPMDRVLEGEVPEAFDRRDRELDHHLVALMDLGWTDATGEEDLRAGEAHEADAPERRHHQEDPCCQQFVLAEPHPQRCQGGSHPERGPAAGRGHQPLTLVPGTGTPAAMPLTISSSTAPRIWASGRRISRWVRTGLSKPLTSSGVT